MKDRPPIDPFSIQDAEVSIATIHRDWGETQGNYDELRFFTGLRPCEEIALVTTDYDAATGVLSIAAFWELTRTSPKQESIAASFNVRSRSRPSNASYVSANGWSGPDSSIMTICSSRIPGTRIPYVKHLYVRWHRTINRLTVRYRKPHVARHTSVSWNLVIGRNPLSVAKEHGHRITTMFSVYAA